MQVYIDIETIPTQRKDIKAAIAKDVHHPANMSKPETIEAWEKDKKPAAVDAAVHKTGLDGTFGEIWCIAYAVKDGKIQLFSRDGLPSSEADLLKEFYNSLWWDMDGGMRRPEFVGHNVSFDLRFIHHRSVVNSVYPKVKIPYNATPWSGDYYCTMNEWAGARGTISLKNLCLALGVDVKSNGLDGSKVWQYILAGKFDEVEEYCKEDVAAVRSIYKKLNFIEEQK